jgi:C-terminal processing protease CtpA/Prc
MKKMMAAFPETKKQGVDGFIMPLRCNFGGAGVQEQEISRESDFILYAGERL